MNPRTLAYALASLPLLWAGCASPRTETSENLPSQIANDPEVVVTGININAHPVGGLGLEGVAGVPNEGEIPVVPAGSYQPPDLDWENLQDELPDTPVYPPQPPENLQTFPGPEGQAGVQESIVQGTPGSDLPENPGANPPTGTPDLPWQPAIPHLASNLSQDIPHSDYGEATATPIFVETRPGTPNLPGILAWLDHQDIAHPPNFADTSEALSWIRQELTANPDSFSSQPRDNKALMSWLDGLQGQPVQPGQNRPQFAANLPWQIQAGSDPDAANTRPPVLLSKASLWLRQSTQAPNAQSQPANSPAPLRPLFPHPQASQAANTSITPGLKVTGLDYGAALNWLQQASSHPKDPQNFRATLRQTPSNHTEALRWIQSASGKRKAPLHAAILAPGSTNP